MDYNSALDTGNLTPFVILLVVSHSSSLFVGDWHAARNAEHANESGSTSHGEVEKGKTWKGPQEEWNCSWSVKWSSQCTREEEPSTNIHRGKWDQQISGTDESLG